MEKMHFKLSLIIMMLLVSLSFTSCATMMGYGTTKAKVVYDDYYNTSFITKSVALPMQSTGWWKINLYSFDQDSIDFDLDFQNPDWYFINKMDLIIDETRYHYYDDNPTRDVLSGGIITEQASFDMPISVFDLLINSTNAKIRFVGSDGTKEYTVTDTMKSEFQSYLNFLELHKNIFIK